MTSPSRFSLHWRKLRPSKYLGVVVTAFALLLGTAIPAAAAEQMRITFIRHAESLGNTSGLIETSTPGPVLSALGQQQAATVPSRMGDRNFDGIYASTMVRTQLTAGPLSQYLGLPVQVLPGLREIEAGDYEGLPERDAYSTYALAPFAWALANNLDARIPGSTDGHEFNARMNESLQAMYDTGDRNAVAFTHGAAMMIWSMMNAQNVTPAEKMALLRGSMTNTGYVVLEGNPTDGWKLMDWNGQQFARQHSFVHEVALQIRTLSRQLGDAAKTIIDSFATRDIAAIAIAINRGLSEAQLSLVKFTRAVTTTAIERLENVFAPKPEASTVTSHATPAAAEAPPEADIASPEVTAAAESSGPSNSSRLVSIYNTKPVVETAVTSVESVSTEKTVSTEESVSSEGAEQSTATEGTSTGSDRIGSDKAESDTDVDTAKAESDTDVDTAKAESDTDGDTDKAEDSVATERDSDKAGSKRVGVAAGSGSDSSGSDSSGSGSDS